MRVADVVRDCRYRSLTTKAGGRAGAAAPATSEARRSGSHQGAAMKALNAAFLIATLCGLVDYIFTRVLLDKIARLLGRFLAFL